MKKRQKLLTDEQWELIAPLFPQAKRRADKRGRPPAPNRACLRVFSGFCRRGRRGAFSRTSFPPPRPAGDGCNAGKSKGFGWKLGALYWGRWMKTGCCAGTRVFWTAVSHPPKRGRCGRENQARQGNEVDGTGRR